MIIIFSQTKPAMAVSLSTNSRWIVNKGGQRVKLACVNWVSHLAPVVAEWIQSPRGSCPWDSIVLARLTWPVLSLATNLSLASLTVRQSFERLGLSQYSASIQANNPSIIDLSLIKAFQVTCMPMLISSKSSHICMHFFQTM